MYACALLYAVALLANEPAVSMVDLTKISHTITKEPTYQGQPKYVLLVFGQDAATKVWVVFDGDALYVDTDGSGDLTAPNKYWAQPTQLAAVCAGQRQIAHYADLPIKERDGKTEHKLNMKVDRSSGAITLQVSGPRTQYTGGIDDGILTAADRAADASIVHFGGTLVAMPGGRHWPNTTLEPAEIEQANGILNLQVKLATPGLGRGTYASLNPAAAGSLATGSGETLGNDGILAELEYPSGRAGQPMIKQRVKMGLTCCCGFYSASVQMPADVAAGRAKVAFTFPGSSPSLVAAKSYAFELKAVDRK